MKTISYKTGNTMKAMVASLIILASYSGIAKAENSGKESAETGTTLQVAAYNAKEFVESDMMNETDFWMNSNDDINSNVAESELALQETVYNAKNFVEPELATETESWMNSNDGTGNNVAVLEIALQLAQYNPMEFAVADFAREAENWINNDATGYQSEKGTNYNNELANN